MNQSNTNPQKSRNGWMKLSLVINLLLCLVLIGGILTFWIFERQRSVQTLQQTELLEQQLADAQAEIDELKDTTIPVETFQGYVQQFSPGTEFIQKFFPDKIVYKDHTGVVYADIDTSLSRNTYDWDGLFRKDGRISYRPAGGAPALAGVDVSKHQGEIDWQKVKADGIDFAMIRAVYRGYGESGKLMTDQTFEENIDGALAAGVDAGIYVFSQAVTKEEAVEEAELAIELLDGREISYPVVFDMEKVAEGARIDRLSPAEITEIAIAFCETVREAGYRPMIYGNVQWLVTCLDLTKLTEYDIWLAQYFRTPAFPYEFDMWQYSSAGHVDGIDGNVDLNLCFRRYP